MAGLSSGQDGILRSGSIDIQPECEVRYAVTLSSLPRKSKNSSAVAGGSSSKLLANSLANYGQMSCAEFEEAALAEFGTSIALMKAIERLLDC